MRYEDWLFVARRAFPNLTRENSRQTSPEDESYNCIAWAAHDVEHRWWPDALQQCYWPAGVARCETIEAFREAYGHIGYQIASNASLEGGLEKIAIFVDRAGKPTHAARQLRTGRWTSKLGPNIDIEHELLALEGPTYGRVMVIMARASSPAEHVAARPPSPELDV